MTNPKGDIRSNVEGRRRGKAESQSGVEARKVEYEIELRCRGEGEEVYREDEGEDEPTPGGRKREPSKGSGWRAACGGCVRGRQRHEPPWPPAACLSLAWVITLPQQVCGAGGILGWAGVGRRGWAKQGSEVEQAGTW